MGVAHQPMAIFQGTNVQNGSHHTVPPPFSMQQLQHMHMMSAPPGKSPSDYVCRLQPYLPLQPILALLAIHYAWDQYGKQGKTPTR